jgi:hypothetical protein
MSKHTRVLTISNTNDKNWTLTIKSYEQQTSQRAKLQFSYRHILVVLLWRVDGLRRGRVHVVVERGLRGGRGRRVRRGRLSRLALRLLLLLLLMLLLLLLLLVLLDVGRGRRVVRLQLLLLRDGHGRGRIVVAHAVALEGEGVAGRREVHGAVRDARRGRVERARERTLESHVDVKLHKFEKELLEQVLLNFEYNKKLCSSSRKILTMVDDLHILRCKI